MLRGFGTGHDGFSYADRNNRAGVREEEGMERGWRWWLVVTSVESFPETRPMCRKKEMEIKTNSIKWMRESGRGDGKGMLKLKEILMGEIWARKRQQEENKMYKFLFKNWLEGR